MRFLYWRRHGRSHLASKLRHRATLFWFSLCLSPSWRAIGPLSPNYLRMLFFSGQNFIFFSSLIFPSVSQVLMKKKKTLTTSSPSLCNVLSNVVPHGDSCPASHQVTGVVSRAKNDYRLSITINGLSLLRFCFFIVPCFPLNPVQRFSLLIDCA
ncbi:uncharacterized protein BYT42DRAFT_384442 [Radiomyces spectabilis]|uniref:uncharacterized protein n=1 Tax=Radiomyces spectabilis TaxID=64574 RepID=UPI00221FE83C|nr:uncharacterized protein BYT42DRAFT_384442 [Radiomyces spectabilis]KAI8376366.1 hypothetical protein BYT42DRAFT_384442 [Radiomyces spectabilis]